MKTFFSHIVFACSLVLLIQLPACNKPFYAKQYADTTYQVSLRGNADTAMLQMLQPYKAGVDTQMEMVVGHTDIPLTKAQPECTLGNFMADAQMEAAIKIDPKVVGSVVNYGGIRIPYINPGVITRGKIYELMPFDNMLTIVDVPGSTLHKFCDAMAARKGWPVSGITYTIKDKKADSVFLGGRPVNDNIIYKIAMSDYIANGGDNCDFLVSLRKRSTTVFLRDALISYIKDLEREGRPLHPEITNRVSYAK